MRNPILKVENLGHTYAKVPAVSAVSFSVHGPGVVGLLGANGAGKSTILNAISGVLNPTEGDVIIDGYSIRRSPLVAKAKIGFLPQHVPVYPELTVDEYLTYCAQLRGVERRHIPDAVQNAKVKCGIGHFSRRLIGALSGGYQQRCGMAQAILHEPSIVVFDEPTNGLDPLQVSVVRNLIREIASERTVLISTHILTEVEALCAHIRMIDQGALVFDGSIDEFLSSVNEESIVVAFSKRLDIECLQKMAAVRLVKRHFDDRFILESEDVNATSRAIISYCGDNDVAITEFGRARRSLDEAFQSMTSKA